MATTTTRVGLIKPAGTEDYDVGVFNANADQLDLAVGILDITSTTFPADPFPGQIVRNTTDNLYYQRVDTGWVVVGVGPVADTAARRHEARYESRGTPQSIPNGADTVLQWNTAVYASADVTVSGTNNTLFTLNRAGLWELSASTRFPSAPNGERYLFISTGSTSSLANRLVGMSSESASPASLAATTSSRFAAGTVIHAGAYQGSGAALSIDNAFGGSNHIALTWLRP